MAALSDYLESGLLNHVFRGGTFDKPTNIAIALTSGVPLDSNTGKGILYGGTLPEIASGINYDGIPTLGGAGVGSSGTGYNRVSIGSPVNNGDSKWSHTINDIATGSGFIRNSGNIIFNTALTDWGWVSGVAITDHGTVGSGNLLMHAQLSNPRVIFTGDNVKFDIGTLEISFK
jgi:hypothetical protein